MAMPETTNQTLGERIVRADFNASRDNAVSNLKNSFARMINLVDSITLKAEEGTDYPTVDDMRELDRLKQLAINDLERAAMWAVKAATI